MSNKKIHTCKWSNLRLDPMPGTDEILFEHTCAYPVPPWAKLNGKIVVYKDDCSRCKCYKKQEANDA